MDLGWILFEKDTAIIEGAVVTTLDGFDPILASSKQEILDRLPSADWLHNTSLIVGKISIQDEDIPSLRELILASFNRDGTTFQFHIDQAEPVRFYPL